MQDYGRRCLAGLARIRPSSESEVRDRPVLVAISGYDARRARCAEIPLHLGCLGEVIVNRSLPADPTVVRFSRRPVGNGEARVVEGRESRGERWVSVALSKGATSRRHEYEVSAAALLPVVQRAIALAKVATPGKREAGAVRLHGDTVVVWARVSPQGERTITLALERPAKRRRQGGSSTMGRLVLEGDELGALERALEWLARARAR